MNRRHTAASYLRIVDKVRAARPDIALSSDFIVGFPGETEADFEQTLEVAEAVGYDGAFTFIYSPRRGTEAAVMADEQQCRPFAFALPKQQLEEGLTTIRIEG